jgi:hypothetical protein
MANLSGDGERLDKEFGGLKAEGQFVAHTSQQVSEAVQYSPARQYPNLLGRLVMRVYDIRHGRRVN